MAKIIISADNSLCGMKELGLTAFILIFAQLKNPFVMKEKLEKIWNYVRIHKYGVTFAVFVLIIGVLDENSWIERLEHRREINRLNTEIRHYRKQFEDDSKLLKEISTNPEALEKVAREKYLMKKDNEDIFIFEQDLEDE